ncbi:MAG: hypothetical protein M1826_004907 [Phylliscum demangeonii]|nr:MAG: hypothetical protein M1826_004907 [Phylliscum demangeonii]
MRSAALVLLCTLVVMVVAAPSSENYGIFRDTLHEYMIVMTYQGCDLCMEHCHDRKKLLVFPSLISSKKEFGFPDHYDAEKDCDGLCTIFIRNTILPQEIDLFAAGQAMSMSEGEENDREKERSNGEKRPPPPPLNGDQSKGLQQHAARGSIQPDPNVHWRTRCISTFTRLLPMKQVSPLIQKSCDGMQALFTRQRLPLGYSGQQSRGGGGGGDGGGGSLMRILEKMPKVPVE